MTDSTSAPRTVRLADYRLPDFLIDAVDLHFDLRENGATVTSRLTMRRNPATSDPAAPLVLDGQGLKLAGVALDGEALGNNRYSVDAEHLTLPGLPQSFTLEITTEIEPQTNTSLQGLYTSGGNFCTQCEAEGFRHITYYLDRPDVLARYTTTIVADKAKVPVLLSNGNPVGTGEAEGGRHWAKWEDPFPKPSYLFALVAGDLIAVEDSFTTRSGRPIDLKIFTRRGDETKVGHAMRSLKASMAWDERAYGFEYDLDLFMIVAVSDFNMGAMENKGLNIFNTALVLASRETATDGDFQRVESVVAHEYFHNWTGNRITCRDWFQLSLKEGLTVFREQQFSADMNSAALKRIEDVSLLRRAQFPEDAGPLAHPVRPAQYSEINNFYTATVYEKGSELVRMVAGRLGRDGFRRGMDLYFSRNDGRAATLEDFLGALGEANGVDLIPYLAWYSQAGTPRLSARGHYDAAHRTYTLTLSQHTPATPHQPHKQPLPIPVKLALFDRMGHMLPLHLTCDSAETSGATERVVVLDRAEQTFVFQQLNEAPVPSLLRGFSAPVILECAYEPADLALLLRHDPDGFNRWEAGQQLAARAYDNLREGDETSALDAWCEALEALFNDGAMDAALLADLLTPPGEIELSERERQVDPSYVHALRQQLQEHLALRIGQEALQRRYESLATHTNFQLDADSQARRRLKRRVLELLAHIDPWTAHAQATLQYDNAPSMTDRLAALSVLVRGNASQAHAALAHFRERYADNPLAMDKWFSVQTQLPGDLVVDRVRLLENDAAFTLKNPNRVNSLFGAWTRSNPDGFHRPDGSGYRLLAERLTQLDALNPQIAARMATAFNGWQRLEPGRRALARAAIESVAAKAGLSRNLDEIVQSMLRG